MTFILPFITSLVFAEDTISADNASDTGISTDRPSIGTSASVLSKGSLQLESGFHRDFYTPGALEEMMDCEEKPCPIARHNETFQALGRIGIGRRLELRPYYNLSILDASSSSGGIEVKANLFSSETSPHTLGVLLSGQVLQLMWDIGGENWSAWFNGGVSSLFIDDIGNIFYPIGTIGMGKSFGNNHNIYMEYALQRDTEEFWSVGYYKSFGNYQLDCFAIKNRFSLRDTWQSGIGFSWKIK